MDTSSFSSKDRQLASLISHVVPDTLYTKVWTLENTAGGCVEKTHTKKLATCGGTVAVRQLSLCGNVRSDFQDRSNGADLATNI
jgi:hypothetical protein